MVDARLPDGSRVNAVIHPLAIGGPFLTIRKFSKDPYQIDDLIRSAPQRASARFLQACVVGKLNVIVSGGTGTGKTTTLNVLSSFIPSDERIVTVEDAKELQLHQDHVLAGDPARRTSRARARSPSATWSRTACACAPTASWWGSAVAARRSTCSRP
jgi:Flp pilus assembly CpaF family ATPase